MPGDQLVATWLNPLQAELAVANYRRPRRRSDDDVTPHVAMDIASQAEHAGLIRLIIYRTAGGHRLVELRAWCQDMDVVRLAVFVGKPNRLTDRDRLDARLELQAVLSDQGNPRRCRGPAQRQRFAVERFQGNDGRARQRRADRRHFDPSRYLTRPAGDGESRNGGEDETGDGGETQHTGRPLRRGKFRRWRTIWRANGVETESQRQTDYKAIGVGSSNRFLRLFPKMC